MTVPAFSFKSINKENTSHLISMSRKEMSYSAFEKIAKQMPFTQSEWCKFLSLSERTMQRYAKEKKSFDNVSTERVMQIVLYYKRGLEVFENRENFNLYLRSPILALGNEMPVSFLDSTFGIRKLEHELVSIEHFIPA